MALYIQICKNDQKLKINNYSLFFVQYTSRFQRVEWNWVSQARDWSLPRTYMLKYCNIMYKTNALKLLEFFFSCYTFSSFWRYSALDLHEQFLKIFWLNKIFDHEEHFHSNHTFVRQLSDLRFIYLFIFNWISKCTKDFWPTLYFFRSATRNFLCHEPICT